MPQHRKSSPRRKDRRSRSRSHSPRRKRHSRSRSRERRRSRSRDRKRSPERKHRSPPRKRSPSPKRREKSHSRSPKRRTRYSSSPSERGYPVKRPADSSGKRPGYRSRSPSPVQKRSRDDKQFVEESPPRSRSRRSPSPQGYGGKMYSDQPSSSKKPLFPAGSSKRKPEIDYVTIPEKNPKKPKLNKRFETLEQVAQGPFDFEENITIGIHRGPQHIQLHDDEDVEVNYDFNSKTFKMLFPKRDFSRPIFEREEILAFHHDDILDEEAYVEKRTISIKPVDKPKQRKYSDDLDYTITVGHDREGYGDRRMVQDSGSRSRHSRSSAYDDVPVTVRLDPKPDPRYEKIYKEQQRYEDKSLMQEKVQRNPNDLRYNLMRRKSDGDRSGDREDRDRHDRDRRERDERSRDPVKQGLLDARSRINDRRENQGGRRDRSAPERRSPPRDSERKKKFVKTDLPDFKNRPESSRPNQASAWGRCSVCNIALASEAEAVEHIDSFQHQSNEKAFGMTTATPIPGPDGKALQREAGASRFEPEPMADPPRGQGQIRGRGSTKRKFAQIHDDGDDLDDVSDDEANLGVKPTLKAPRVSGDVVWIVGTEDMKRVHTVASEQFDLGADLGLYAKGMSLVWTCLGGLKMKDVPAVIDKMAEDHQEVPKCIILHVGRNDIDSLSKLDFLGVGKHMISMIHQKFRDTKLVWSQILPLARGLNPLRVALDDEMAVTVLKTGGCYIFYPSVDIADRHCFNEDEKGNLMVKDQGCMKIAVVIKGAIVSIVQRNITICPVLQGVPHLVNDFIGKNLGSRFTDRKQPFNNKKFAGFGKKRKFPFFKR